ncbi:MAG: AzlC family ABC transporter permease [Firmicutes bacterium]|nr:AzlC family ABC transporter permease [Bacillota bacterium]
MNKNDLKKAFVASIPVMTGYISLGIGFGILLESKGYGPAWAFLMSFAVYAGSLQYVLVDMMAGGVSLVTTALTSLMVNARHLFYGISVIDKYKGAGWKKPYMIFGLTDETYSLVFSDEAARGVKDKHGFYFVLTLMNQCYWVAGSVIGGAVGTMITFDTTGIDFALTALFITIFVDQWRATKNHGPALIGVGASVLCLVIFGSGNFLIPAMICITCCLLAMKNRWDGSREEVR